MENTLEHERNAKTFAFLVITDLIITLLMRGANTRFDVPHIPYVVIAIICGFVGVISFSGFIYSKINRPVTSQFLLDISKIILLGIMTYFIAAFSIGIVVNL